MKLRDVSEPRKLNTIPVESKPITQERVVEGIRVLFNTVIPVNDFKAWTCEEDMYGEGKVGVIQYVDVEKSKY